MSKGDAITDLQAALKSYPLEGQDGVDKGGWTVAEDSLASSGYQRIEFRSGIGNFAKFFNGGKPFIDDLEATIQRSEPRTRRHMGATLRLTMCLSPHQSVVRILHEQFQVDDSSVSVRSSSRVGDSDFGVNGKRINFLAKELTKRGWTATGVKV